MNFARKHFLALIALAVLIFIAYQVWKVGTRTQSFLWWLLSGAWIPYGASGAAGATPGAYGSVGGAGSGGGGGGGGF